LPARPPARPPNLCSRCNQDNWNLTQAQALGVDVGSVATTLPSTDELVAMGHNLLQFE
jgi:hypothetical protein